MTVLKKTFLSKNNHKEQVIPQEIILRGEGLKRYYHRGSEIVKALDDVDIEIKKGEMVAVVGPSGAGKTTLVNVLSLLDQPTGGVLFLKYEKTTGYDEEKLAIMRRKYMGFIFQRFYLIPTLTVRENIEMPLIFSRQPAFKEKTEKLMKLVGLQDRADHLPRELSGGEMQRVAIARSLIGDPSIIIADEPTGNLDSKNTAEITGILRSLADEKNITVIISTHNMEIARKCDRIITLMDGRIQNVENTSF